MSAIASFVQVALGLAFLVAGASKLAGTRYQVADFGRFRYPPGTMQLVGAIEFLAGAGMLVGLAQPTLAVAAGALIILDMLFLLYSNIVRVGDAAQRSVVPSLFLVGALLVVVIRL